MPWGKHRKVQNFSIPIEKKVTNVDKDGTESVVTILYNIKFFDNARLIAISLSNLIDNLAEKIHKIKCKIVIVFLNMKVLRII